MIREMRIEDIREVVRIEEEIFSNPWSEKSFQDALTSKDNIYLVAVLEGEVAGYCGIWTSYDTADLCNIAVTAKYRKRGIAGKLLHEAVNLTAGREVERILLEVRESNTAAIALYKKFQFQKIGVRRGYYSAPKEDAVLMELCISH